MGIYREIVKNPGVTRVVASQLVARIPAGMTSLLLLLHFERVFNNYSSGGLALAAVSIGQATAGPILGRLTGKYGSRLVLITSASCSAAALLAIAFVPLPYAVMVILSLFLGLTLPPVHSVARTLYSRLVPGTQLPGLYSLDATAQEVIWAVGPVIAVFIAQFINPAAGLLLCATTLLGGVTWLAFLPELKRLQIPRAKKRFGAVLKRPPALLAVFISLAFIAGFAAMEVAIIAVFGNHSVESGFVIGANAVGSFVGGLTFGHRPLTRWNIGIRISLMMLVMLLSLINISFWWLLLMMFIGGIGCAPALAAINSLVSATVRFSETAEAFGWIASGQLVGAAIGSALAGVAADISGAPAAIITAAALFAIAIIIALAGNRWIPNLRGVDISPAPDTATTDLPILR
ncbi:MFS transporter [Leucobacter sp. OH1287]|uniref:MFS transporter n=1 Tax=Leucobacter sp. OH1287 TaxID=2491049 RepID=UPI000F5F0D9F|nr:MFS transporter [Leucobacter sp. OH1287]RRD61596.1 MFS transporter [Leucobacter sp. OH1287]